DRPPELRDTGANQTIPQPALFGEFVRWRFDLPAPAAEIDPAFVLTTADQAVHRAVGRPRGPVHLNCMFREPLAAAAMDDVRLAGWRVSGEPYTRYVAPESVDRAAVADLATRLRGVERGLVVAGRLRTRAEGEAAARLAETLGWPLLPDVGSQVRFEDSAVASPYYDQALGSDGFREGFAPEAVVHLGGRVTSKRLARLLADARPAPFVVVRDDPFRFDPDHRVTDRVVADVEQFCDAFVEVLGEAGPPSGWLD